MIRYYYNIQEIAGFTSADSPFYAKTNNKDFGDVVGSSFTDTTETTKLFQEFIYPRYYDSGLVYIDVDNFTDKPLVTDTEVAARITKFKGKLWAWLNSTVDVYTKLIKIYTKSYDELMAKVNSETLSKYNDTPQDGGNFDTDDHTTTSTRTTNSTDAGTPIQRMDEIRRRITDIYNEWSRDFAKLIVGD